jgi:hypothetical protein
MMMYVLEMVILGFHLLFGKSVVWMRTTHLTAQRVQARRVKRVRLLLSALTDSINNHGESLIKVARITALQQEKDQIMTRIASLRDLKRELSLRLVSVSVFYDETVKHAIHHENEVIESEIEDYTLQLDSMTEKLHKNSCNPN